MRTGTGGLPEWRSITIAETMQFLVQAMLAAVLVISATRLQILQGDQGTVLVDDGGGNMLRQLLYVSAAAILLLATLLAPRPRLVPVPHSLILLLGWCALSLSWSATPMVGLRRLILLTMIIWMIFVSMDLLGYRRGLAVVTATFVMLLAASYAAVALSPAAIHTGMTAVDDPSVIGSWRGIVPHKNDAGPLCVYTVLLLFFGAGNWPRALRMLLILAALLFLIKTQSKTSIATLGAAILVGLLFLIYRPRYRLLALPVLLIVACGLFVVASQFVPDFLYGLESSRDAFTGRIQIWRILVNYLDDHAWLGTGFGSFWAAGPASPLSDYVREAWIRDAVTTGHNGYLDIWVQIGLPGLFLAISALFVMPFFTLLTSHRMQPRYGALSAAILTFAVAHNLTESTALLADTLGNIMVMIAIATISGMHREALPQPLRTGMRPFP